MTMYGALESQDGEDHLSGIGSGSASHNNNTTMMMDNHNNNRRRRTHQHDVMEDDETAQELTSFSMLNAHPTVDPIAVENDGHTNDNNNNGSNDDGEELGLDGQLEVQDKSKFVRFLRMLWNWIIHNLMLILTLIGVVLGLIIGISLNVSAHGSNPTIEISQMTIDFLKLPGEFFLRALNCLIVPLIVSSMVTSITSIVDTIKENDTPLANSRQSIDNSQDSNTEPIVSGSTNNNNNGTMNDNYAQVQKKKHSALMKMACLTLSFYLMTTFIAVVTGLVMVNLIQPGKININQNNETTQSTLYFNNQPSINLQGEMYPIGGVMGVFATNMLMDTSINGTNNSTGGDKSSYHQIISIIESFVPNNLIDAASNTVGGSVNVLGLIVFSIFFALVMLAVGEPAKPIIKIFNSLNVIILKMVSIIICYAPIGIMFLIIWRCVKEKDLLQAMSQLALYIATVFSGLAFHSFVTLTFLYTILVRRNILKHLLAVFPALLTGVSFELSIS